MRRWGAGSETSVTHVFLFPADGAGLSSSEDKVGGRAEAGGGSGLHGRGVEVEVEAA